jgi:hypothetical protein
VLDFIGGLSLPVANKLPVHIEMVTVIDSARSMNESRPARERLRQSHRNCAIMGAP